MKTRQNKDSVSNSLNERHERLGAGKKEDGPGKTGNKAPHKVKCNVKKKNVTCFLSSSDVNEEWTEERGPWAPGRTEIEGPGLPWRG